MTVRMTVFSVPKDGNTEHDWEDKALVRRGPDGELRFVVLDGASEAFEAVRWVNQIATGFVPDDPHQGTPELDPRDMRKWFEYLQDRWERDAPPLRNVIEQRKFREGSFATMLAGTVTGLDTDRPRWQAMALGDTVLFHVRDGRIEKRLPWIEPDGFNLTPAGVSTKPGQLDRMVDALDRDEGSIEPGDRLFVATDAFAEWILRRTERQRRELFDLLGGLCHPDQFAALVADWRAAGPERMTNDDVTLLRLTFSDRPAARLAVCR